MPRLRTWQQKRAYGAVVVVRYADDVVVGFQVKSDAVRFRADNARIDPRFVLKDPARIPAI